MKTAVLSLLLALSSQLLALAHASDTDKDGLSDETELAIARQFSPKLVWSPKETCGDHQTFFQVRPEGKDKATVTYVVTFKEDCGYPFLGMGAHHGDTQEFYVHIVGGGERWEAGRLEMKWYPAAPMVDGRPRIYVSAGKHHLYPTLETCAAGLKGKFEHCGGGAEVVEVLDAAHNAGEREHPAITSLEPFGFKGETAWGKSSWGDDLFCGGDPGRGGFGGFLAKVKDRISRGEWGACGESMELKWR